MALAKTPKNLQAISQLPLMDSAHARENQDYFPWIHPKTTAEPENRLRKTENNSLAPCETRLFLPVSPL